MKINVLDSYEDLSMLAADILVRQLEEKKDLMFCAATGNSPDGVYSLITEEYKQRPELFDGLKVIKLDEWGGVPMEDPGTCESYLQSRLIKPLLLDSSRYISFQSDP
ncbi:MAG: hypothetical protein ABIY90_18135, partial [Puia sp.]